MCIQSSLFCADPYISRLIASSALHSPFTVNNLNLPNRQPSPTPSVIPPPRPSTQCRYDLWYLRVYPYSCSCPSSITSISDFSSCASFSRSVIGPKARNGATRWRSLCSCSSRSILYRIIVKWLGLAMGWFGPQSCYILCTKLVGTRNHN